MGRQAIIAEEELRLLEQKALAFDEWMQKTEWVQKQMGSFSPLSLGLHRADVMREEIERLRRHLKALS